MPLSNNPRITVYADISCPFCFVLHERLSALDMLDKVQWRTIEHAPGANSSSRDIRQIEQLNEEYRLILKRAADVKVTNPGFIPNTALANQYLTHIAAHFPEKLIECRAEIYRALWQKSLDISNREVLWQLLKALGVEVKGIGPEVSETLSRWQRKWQYGDFDSRIPVMQRAQNEVMLGLQHSQTIGAFVRFDEIENLQKGNICRFISKDRVSVLCRAEHENQLLGLARDENIALTFFRDSEALLKDLKQNPPDLILLDELVDDVLTLCSTIKDIEGMADLPLVVLSSDLERDQEKKAFKMGAVDYICLAAQTDAFCSRLKNHISCKHRMDILTDHASHDALTGLYNKRELSNCLERAWRYACRHQKTLGILMLDIDHFKAFNDRYGHPAGDDAMIRVASAINENIHRDHDIAARFGGEEFAVILPDVDKDNLKVIAQRIGEAVEALKISHDDSSCGQYVTVSIGGALTDVHADNNYSMLLGLADECLYRAKAKGRNTQQFAELAKPKY